MYVNYLLRSGDGSPIKNLKSSHRGRARYNSIGFTSQMRCAKQKPRRLPPLAYPEPSLPSIIQSYPIKLRTLSSRSSEEDCTEEANYRLPPKFFN
jgi:hypothetical protein